MARLQILELPEGADDSRPPFVLVVDEYLPRRYVLGAGQTGQPRSEFDGVAERIGARAVLTFTEQVEIPANDVSAEFRESLRSSIGEVYESARTSLSESETLGHQLLQRAENAEGRSRAMEVQRDRAARRAEQAEAGRVAADTMLRTVCEVFGGPHQDPVVKARETLARAEQAEAKLQALAEAQRREELDRMDSITDALGFDRLRDWGEIVSAIKRQRQSDVDGGHRFLAVPEHDGGLRCSACGVTRDLWADLPGTPTCAAIKERGYY